MGYFYSMADPHGYTCQMELETTFDFRSDFFDQNIQLEISPVQLAML